MSDFLTALAGAALGLPGSVEPRPRSRFEELPATPWGEETVESEVPAPTVRETERPRALAADERPRLSEFASEVPAPDAAPFAEPSAQAQTREQTAEPATVIRHVRVAESPPALPTEPRPAPADSPLRLEPAAEREAARNVEPPRALRISDAIAHRDALPPPTAAPPVIAAREPPVPIVIVPDIVETAHAELPRAKLAPPEVTASRPAEPPPAVIEVTIGRVEVRLVPPPAAPAQPAAKFAPALPLADYLARRHRGGA